MMGHFESLIVVRIYDSSLHYPQLANFPHHRHLYPKDKYPPVGFSGKLSDALAEARWIIEKLP